MTANQEEGPPCGAALSFSMRGGIRKFADSGRTLGGPEASRYDSRPLPGRRNSHEEPGEAAKESGDERGQGRDNARRDDPTITDGLAGGQGGRRETIEYAHAAPSGYFACSAKGRCRQTRWCTR